MNRRSILFYCHHSVGMGHLVRSASIAEALSAEFHVVLACGGRIPSAAATRANVEFVQLPPVGSDADGMLFSLDGRRSVERAMTVRRKRILELFRELRPAALVIEFYPFGRTQFAGELLPVLRCARSAGEDGPAVVCSVRDLLERKSSNRRLQDDLASSTANRYFDAVLVHSDPLISRLDETFRPSIPLTVPVHYTGFVVPRERSGSVAARRKPSVLVSCGGGRVGGELLRCCLQAFKRFGFGAGVEMTLVAGPFLPPSDWLELRVAAKGVPGLRLRRWIPDLLGELRSSAASVSQCGYNTAMDLLRARVPALVVPFTSPRDGEQLSRAKKLEALGVTRVMTDSHYADPENLAAEIRKTLRFQPDRQVFNLEGARRSAEIIQALVAGRSGRGASSILPARASEISHR